MPEKRKRGIHKIPRNPYCTLGNDSGVLEKGGCYSTNSKTYRAKPILQSQAIDFRETS